MAYSYTTRDGQRLEVHVAAAFDRMNADFKRAMGAALHVRSGTRTTAEQEKIFRSRYVTAGNVKGRRVYDTRWWKGVKWYRVSPAGTVAVPRTSNHEEGGPVGPRALDIYGGGTDRFGSAGTKWMERNAGKYGFDNDGFRFGEAWHKTFRGKIGGPLTPPPRKPSAADTIKSRQNFLNKYRKESLKVDGDWGPASVAANKRYQTFLRKYGYKGGIDGIWGAGQQAAHAKYVAALKK